MAQFEKKTDDGEFGLEMTPMIDVIFQLIIFFMCSIHFKTLDGKFLTPLPKDKGQRQIQVTKFEVEETRVQISYDYKSDVVKIKIGDKEYNRDDELFDILRAKKTDDAPIKIAPEPIVPNSEIVRVLNACNKAGVKKIEFSATELPKKK